MKETIKEILITRGGDPALKLSADKPAVLMMVGVKSVTAVATQWCSDSSMTSRGASGVVFMLYLLSAQVNRAFLLTYSRPTRAPTPSTQVCTSYFLLPTSYFLLPTSYRAAASAARGWRAPVEPPYGSP